MVILANNNNINVVISDMKMPGMNSVELIRKAKEKYKHIVYFILTGFDVTYEFTEALKQKTIHKYFRKPAQINQITKSIKEFGLITNP